MMELIGTMPTGRMLAKFRLSPMLWTRSRFGSLKHPRLISSIRANSDFAVYYELKDPGPNPGKHFWDNNFSQDYFVGKAEGTTIQ